MCCSQSDASDWSCFRDGWKKKVFEVVYQLLISARYCNYSNNSINRTVRWAKLAVLAMYCRFGYRTVRLIELLE